MGLINLLKIGLDKFLKNIVIFQNSLIKDLLLCIIIVTEFTMPLNNADQGGIFL